MHYRGNLVFALLILAGLAACKSPETMTARQAGCAVRDVEIIESVYSREGSTTTWCARCEDRFYMCVTNPRRDRIDCRRVAVGPPCE